MFLAAVRVCLDASVKVFVHVLKAIVLPRKQVWAIFSSQDCKDLCTRWKLLHSKGIAIEPYPTVTFSHCGWFST